MEDFHRARFSAPIPMENIVPIDLVEQYRDDEIVNACFKRAAMMHATREQALIWTVEQLVACRKLLLARCSELLANQPPPPIVIDGMTPERLVELGLVVVKREGA